jgi:hypothetical protein
MRFRNGCVYVSRIKRRFGTEIYIRVTHRNNSRSSGKVKYRIYDRKTKQWTNIFKARPQELKEFKPLTGY